MLVYLYEIVAKFKNIVAQNFFVYDKFSLEFSIYSLSIIDRLLCGIEEESLN